ncbi:hypothetical protein D3C81_1993920 [compost metagenome]
MLGGVVLRQRAFGVTQQFVVLGVLADPVDGNDFQRRQHAARDLLLPGFAEETADFFS